MCDEERGVAAAKPADDSLQADLYTPARHRTLIALRCATEQRPFNMVTDKYYKMEVDLLRRGTLIPSPNTVSRDIRDLYVELSKDVRDYFVVRTYLITRRPRSHNSS